MKKIATMILLVGITAFTGPTKDIVPEKSTAIPSISFAAIHNLNVPMVHVDRRVVVVFSNKRTSNLCWILQ